MDWQRQSVKPLFEDLLWSRPQSKKLAGSLAIIGGHRHDVFAPLSAYHLALQAGIGRCSVIMPDKVPSEVGGTSDLLKVESTPSGGLSKAAWPKIKSVISDSDAMLWPGSLSHDSEATQLLTSALELPIKTVLTGDALDSVIKNRSLYDNSSVVAVLTMAELSTAMRIMESTIAITHNMQLNTLINALKAQQEHLKAGLMTFHNDKLIVSSGGKVCVTDLEIEVTVEEFRWRLAVAAHAAVLWAQFPESRYQALCAAAWLFKENNSG